MSRLGGCGNGLAWTAAAVALGCGTGCRSRDASVELISYQDPYFPDQRRIVFDRCVYRVDGSGNRHIAAQALVVPADVAGGPVTHYLHVQMFWQPVPGRTFADSSGTDAVIRYVIVTPEGTAGYAGTGFVYAPRKSGQELDAKVESATLRLESQTSEAGGVLGDVSLHGELEARRDAAATVDLVRELELHARAR